MLDQDGIQRNLRGALIFKGLEPEELERVVAAGYWRTFVQGQYVYLQGENNRHFYVVAQGGAEITLTTEQGSQIVISHIGPGGHFGETSLLTDSSHGLNVRALIPLTLLCFDPESFDSVLLAHPAIHRQLTIVLANRLRLSSRQHADNLGKSADGPNGSDDDGLDTTFLSEQSLPDTEERPSSDANANGRPPQSTIARQIAKAVRLFSGNLEPVLLSGETGSGQRMVAYEIHRASACKNGPYNVVDIRNLDPSRMDVEMLGYERNDSAFSQVDQLGILERSQGGTVVLYNVEYLEPEFQQRLADIVKTGTFTKVGSCIQVEVRFRIILICTDASLRPDAANPVHPALYELVAGQHFRVAPLREHRRDIPRLVEYYLRRYSLQYGKTILQMDPHILGMFMNYDWPGNMAEMASVIQRAVIIGKSNEPLGRHVLLGMPKPEGKWEFNLLRLRGVRLFFTSRLFPVLPRVVVGILFGLVLAALFFGPAKPEKNIGLTLSWIIGWPLLLFFFFFLARTWCSVCGLSMAGWVAQAVIKPQRPTPPFIRQFSGWAMNTFCILLFWIEITWNAYHSPRITGWIILSVSMGSLIFSMFFKRRVWCRYLCPLGAINALFAMPSVLELRANTHMCTNRCMDHACYKGDDDAAGCPMFRHPFLVDNNRDCILCAQCIKNCKLNSIHLNLRLAPQELWNQQSPRLEDSFLVVSLAAVFYPFAINQKGPALVQRLTDLFHAVGLPHSPPLALTILFFTTIVIYLFGYVLMSWIMARLTKNTWKTTASIFGYGMIPLVLGAFLAAHLEIFLGGIWLLTANLKDLFGMGGDYTPSRFITRDATVVLQIITICGALIASLYATRRIILRLLGERRYSPEMFSLPAFLLCLSAIAYFHLV